MKERPLLMTTEMVKADREGRKDMTRRTAGLDQVNQDPEKWAFQSVAHSVVNGQTRLGVWFQSVYERLWLPCPYGEVGDRLWIRETWCPWYNGQGAFYKADEKYPDGKGGMVGRPIDYDENKVKWKPSIHMPRKFSRTTVEIVEIRVERLQDISEEDAKAEGAAWVGCVLESWKPFGYKEGFKNIWHKINGAESWNRNPWLWAIKYKHL